MSVIHRHLGHDPEIAPFTEGIMPLTRYLVRRAMIRGPFELLGRDWVGSKEWMEEMEKRYPASGKRVLPTRLIMDEKLLEK